MYNRGTSQTEKCQTKAWPGGALCVWCQLWINDVSEIDARETAVITTENQSRSFSVVTGLEWDEENDDGKETTTEAGCESRVILMLAMMKVVSLDLQSSNVHPMKPGLQTQEATCHSLGLCTIWI